MEWSRNTETRQSDMEEYRERSRDEEGDVETGRQGDREGTQKGVRLRLEAREGETQRRGQWEKKQDRSKLGRGEDGGGRR